MPASPYLAAQQHVATVSVVATVPVTSSTSSTSCSPRPSTTAPPCTSRAMQGTGKEVEVQIGTCGITLIKECADVSATGLVCACLKDSLLAQRQVRPSTRSHVRARPILGWVTPRSAGPLRNDVAAHAPVLAVVAGRHDHYGRQRHQLQSPLAEDGVSFCGLRGKTCACQICSARPRIPLYVLRLLCIIDEP